MPSFSQAEIIDGLGEFIMADFFTTLSVETRRLVEQKRQFFLSDQFISYLREICRSRTATNSSTNLSPIEQAYYQLKLLFLENARSRGFDYAERQFAQDIMKITWPIL